MSLFKGIYFICKKELKDYFTSPLVYILTALFCLIVGWPFYNRLILAKEWTTGTIVEVVLQPTFFYINSIFLFLAPLMTMRTFAEEKKQNTLNLLFSSNCTHFHIIMGKFFSALSMALFIIAFTFMLPLILAFSGYTNWGLVFSGYLGIFLSVACYIAVGIFTSSLTENQILAALLSFSILLGLMLLVLSANASNNYLLGQMLSYFSINFHLDGFVRGALRSYSFVFYLSFIGFFVFLTERSLDSRNW